MASANGCSPAVAQVVIRVANLPREGRVVDPNLGKGNLHNVTPGRCQIQAAHTMPLGIGPVPLPHSLDRVVHLDGIEPVHGRPVGVTRVKPARRHAPAIVQDRVIEIEQNGSWQSNHAHLASTDYESNSR